MAAKTGNTVHLHYTGRLADGTVFDSTDDRDPVTLELGSGQTLPTFEAEIEGMEPGESKTIEIECAHAYGKRVEERVLTINRSQFPQEVELQVGNQLALELKESQKALALVTDVSDETVTLDLNHPLAGHDLVFEINLVSVD